MPPTVWDGSAYTASAELDAADGYCYYCHLTTPGGKETEVEINTPNNTTEEVRENIQWLLDGYEAKEDFHQWAVRENGRCVGRVMLTVSRRFHTGTVAYYLAERAWGKGYMTEILKRVIDFCFDDLGLNRVEADHFARNPASGKVMEKAGMKKEGLMRQKYCKDGQFLDAVLYAVLKEDRT